MSDISFDGLISSIRSVDCQFTESAVRAVNVGLTLRNWCVGACLSEFELHGAGRASYGEHLFESVASELRRSGMKRCDRRDLRLYVLFYTEYPQVFEVLPEEVKTSLLQVCSSEVERQKDLIEGKWDSASPKSESRRAGKRNALIEGIRDSPSGEFHLKKKLFRLNACFLPDSRGEARVESFVYAYPDSP